MASVKIRLLAIQDQAGRIRAREADLRLQYKQRDEDILAALAEGATERQVAAAARISCVRVHQIKGRRLG